ncbi:MAG TPA: sulfotransferase [Burkholderiaceae bacterium]|nr:sulfotransferase [Burkholderiaceae bacterium]
MPVFMIGTQRSGSNLLRLMLNQLPNIAAPHPPHILHRMTPLLPVYGDLSKASNFAMLVEDVCRLIELNPVAWEGVTLDRRQIAAACRERSLVAVFGATYQALAEARGAQTWMCKSMQNTLFLAQIEAYFPDARYIYLYRDGRDVAVSFRKAVVGEKHFFHIAKEWGETQRLALAHRAVVPAERFANVSYEELTAQPEATMQRLCAFLGAAYHPSMLEFHKSDEAKRAAESSALWGNVVKPVMTDNTRKFLREAAAEDIRVFEHVAGDVLDALGYERVYVKRGEERVFSAEATRAFDEVNKRLKQEVLAGVDQEDLKRRDQQSALLTQIKQRVPLAA